MQWTNTKGLSDLDFPDAIASHLENIQDLQSLVANISSTVASSDLAISTKKTKNMSSGDHQPRTDIFIDKKEVEVVVSFTYLGSSINNHGDVDREFKCKGGEVSAAFNRLMKIWDNKAFEDQPRRWAGGWDSLDNNRLRKIL